MSVPVRFELDISDVMEAITKHVAEKYPDFELTGVTVKSWNHTVFEVVGGVLLENHHRVDPARRKMK